IPGSFSGISNVVRPACSRLDPTGNDDRRSGWRQAGQKAPSASSWGSGTAQLGHRPTISESSFDSSIDGARLFAGRSSYYGIECPIVPLNLLIMERRTP